MNISEETEEVKQAKALEIDSVKAAEKGDFVGSLALINRALQLTPNRASCYNNRAQVYQLSTNIEGKMNIFIGSGLRTSIFYYILWKMLSYFQMETFF